MGDRSKQNFDVLVVGSGAPGGWACKRLAEAGLKVALVDAGRSQSDANFTEHQPDFQFKYRNRARNLIAKTGPFREGTPTRPTSTGWRRPRRAGRATT